MSRIIRVTAPSRLHFGMFAFGQPGVREFGGVGVMIDRPGVRLKISPSEQFETSGPLADRAASFAWKITAALGCELPRCHLQVETAPRQHIGLGVGTSLGLAVARGLEVFLDLPPRSVAELARLTGRALRSSVGLHGFEHGGLIVEAGALAPGQVGPLVARVELPDAWRFLLIAPPAGQGLSGEAEHAAFDALPPVPPERSARLTAELVLHLLPAAREANFAQFSASLFRYGESAGMCFAPHQGGPYASAELERLVHTVRALGVEGVGQTSWGPLLFALLPNENLANRLLAQLQQLDQTRHFEFTLAAPCNRGASLAIARLMIDD